jgi:hypothetical protein
LTVHPEKTKVVKFTFPGVGRSEDKQNGTFDFLGFTHYWRRNLE